MSEWEIEGQGGSTAGLDDDELGEDDEGAIGDLGSEEDLGGEPGAMDDEEPGGGL